jgi:cyanophycinase
MNLSVQKTGSIIWLASALALSTVGGVFARQGPRGHLVIIGGGNRGPAIMSTFVRLAGDAKAKIVIFPMASELAATAGPEQTAFIKQFGAGEVLYLNLNRSDADGDAALRLLEGVTGIFFSGGDQSRLTAALKGTKVELLLHKLYEEGAVIGGTSAGAAVMSRIMLTGDERLNKDASNAFSIIQKANVVTADGFGFLDTAIVDQHFIKRKRHNRLISLVLEHPNLIGIGIDEATAIVVNPERTFDVVGDATVMVFDATRARGIAADANGNLSAADIRMHLLKSGDRYDLKTKKVILKAGVQ